MKEGAEKKIQLSILRKRNLVCVKIINSMDNLVFVKNGRFKTTKADSSKHGLGIKNMMRVIQRYRGYINIDYNDAEFSVVMTIPVPGEGVG